VIPRTRVSYIPAAAFVARTSVLRDCHGFNESMHVGEDVDLVWRICNSGYTVRYEPQSIVLHDHRTRPSEFAMRRYQYGTSAATLHKNHPGLVPPFAVSAWSAAAWALVGTTTPLGVIAGVGVALGSASALPKKLKSLKDSRKIAWQLAIRGHLGAGRQIASALWRAYVPVMLVGALFSRRVRRIAFISGVLPNLLDWKEKRPSLDPFRYVGIRMLDDVAYCAGVWTGCIEQKTAGPLTPDLTSWPGKQTKTKMDHDSEF
jgi:mycofactocin glycosyltransferase